MVLMNVVRVLLFLVALTSAAWTPTPGTTFQWQLTGTIDLSVDAAVFDIDLFEARDSDIQNLHSRGKKVICYFSAGSLEDWRSDVSSVPSSAIGRPLEGWAGEHWWDIRAASVRNVISGRLDLARSRNCDAVEPDNVDGYSNANGLSLTRADQLNFNRWVATEAHNRGLSVGLKNAVELIPELQPNFDWALNEECVEYDECTEYQPFLSNNKAVFHVEYVDSHNQGASKQQSVCHSAQRPTQFSTLIKDWDLSAWRLTC